MNKHIAKIALQYEYDVEYIKNIWEHCTSIEEFYNYFKKEEEKIHLWNSRGLMGTYNCYINT